MVALFCVRPLRLPVLPWPERSRTVFEAQLMSGPSKVDRPTRPFCSDEPLVRLLRSRR